MSDDSHLEVDASPVAVVRARALAARVHDPSTILERVGALLSEGQDIPHGDLLVLKRYADAALPIILGLCESPDADPWTRLAAVYVAREIYNFNQVNQLVPLLSHRDARVRSGVLLGMKRVGRPNPASVLYPLLDDVDLDIVDRARTMILNRPHPPDVRDAFLSRFTRADEKAKHVLAASLLEAGHGQDVIDFIEANLQSASPQDVGRYVKALERIIWEDDQEALRSRTQALLVYCARRPDAHIEDRMSALRALRYAESERFQPLLDELAAGDDPTMQWAARHGTWTENRPPAVVSPQHEHQTSEERRSTWRATLQAVFDRGLLGRNLDESDIELLLEELCEYTPSTLDADMLVVFIHAHQALLVPTRVEVSPPPHDQLVLDLADNSLGRLQPEAVVQEANDAGEGFVQFIHQNQLYRVRVRSLDRAYDVERILLAVNTAVAASGKPERFVALKEIDAPVRPFIFIDPARAREAVEEGLLEL